MDVLFLSHCVPNPPDKGEKIRAHHELDRLAGQHRVHLVCFAKQRADVPFAKQLEQRCASVYVEALRPMRALAKAGVHFALGRCLTTAYYGSGKMQQHIKQLTRTNRLDATIVYSSAMAQYAPASVPMFLDMVDVDSEKWLQYSRVRHPKIAYAIESGRLRRKETEYGERAVCSFLSTEAEKQLFVQFAPGAAARTMGNGVDFAYFDPAACPANPALANLRYVVFVGAMDYYPNADAVCWFAESVFPALRREYPDVEFIVAGRDPAPSVQRLAQTAGITVTGSVPDVRPYLLHAAAVVVPLRIARGIQNKVLEALALGKTVYASDAVCRTFGADLPEGLVRCDSAQSLESAISAACSRPAEVLPKIRTAAQGRFTWDASMAVLDETLSGAVRK